MSQIHWFPGHMSKALKQIEEKIKIVDVVIELLDARAPLSSINKDLEKLIVNKKKLIVLTKADLADPQRTNNILNFLINKYDKVLLLNLNDKNATKEISKAVNELGKNKWEKEKAKGMKPQAIKAMILGIPNVGKSSLINRLANRKAAGVQNKPGFTRGEQWIKVNNDFILLDTPGILPMNYNEKEKAANLALIGSIREEILPKYTLVEILLNSFQKNYPDALKQRYGIESIRDKESILTAIADRRKLLDSKGNFDLLKAETLLLKEFKDGLLGRFTLDDC